MLPSWASGNWFNDTRPLCRLSLRGPTLPSASRAPYPTSDTLTKMRRALCLHSLPRSHTPAAAHAGGCMEGINPGCGE